jgi:hypothetical protein
MNNWLGLNDKELVILSLEHPPIWISLVHAALTQKSFNKSFVTTVVDKYNKSGKGDEFLKALIDLTKSQKKE